jgi:hypothetical protein
MRNFIKQNPWFFAGLVVTVFLSLWLVHVQGFWDMNKTISPMPERLREMTFPIWDKYSFFQHGFLTYTTPKDFEQGIAYSNHSTAYLFFMYPFYKIEMLFLNLPMRVVVAYLEMMFYVMTVFYVVTANLKKRIEFNQVILVLLATMYLVTMPDFWISAGKFNVDNLFHLIFPMLLLIAHHISHGVMSGTKLWVSLGIFCILSPISGALLGTYLLVLSIRNDELTKPMFKLGVMIIFISVAIYLQPLIVSRILRFSSSNSGWIFRAGLDGDVSNFNNVVNAVIKPFYPRPLYLILVPISLLLAQLAFMRFKAMHIDSNEVVLSNNGNKVLFYGILFSQYMITCLLWPQSISIHPYLYDFMLVAPICTWILLNFVSSRYFVNNSRIWIWIMLFFISFNLQQISQAKSCFYCFYPSWTPNQYVIKP